MSEQTSELAAALAKVQAGLPQIVKDETARVPTKDGGSYSYTYADLASISEAVLPLLAEHGLSFVAKPTVLDTGVFVLAYSLLHASGEREDGSYPLPNNGTPQQAGSAITYARRYVLCAVTGVAPEDDDGQAAQQAATAPVDLSILDGLIAQARERGIDGDYEATREWAAERQANADKAASVLRAAILDHDSSGGAGDHAGEAPSEGTTDPQGEGEAPHPDGWDVPPPSDNGPWGWQQAARDAGAGPVEVLKQLISDWPSDDQAARPNRIGDVSALVEAGQGDKVEAAIAAVGGGA